MMDIEECSLMPLRKIENHSGNITSIENNVDLPFIVQRVFYLYDIKSGETRGAHAHKECHQFLVAASGSFDVVVTNGGISRTFSLNRPDIGLHIPPKFWATECNFSSGAICLVLASHKFDEEDYIRDYNDYLNFEKL